MLYLFILFSLPHDLGQSLNFLVSKVLPFPNYNIVGIIQYVTLADWLISLSNMHLGFLHGICGLIAHFFILQRIFHCMGVPQFIQSSIEEHFGCFKFLTFMNKAAISIHGQVLIIKFSNHLSKHLGPGLLDYIVKLGLTLSKTAKLSSKVAILFFIPINNE